MCICVVNKYLKVVVTFDLLRNLSQNFDQIIIYNDNDIHSLIVCEKSRKGSVRLYNPMDTKFFLFLIFVAQKTLACNYYEADATRQYSAMVCTNITTLDSVPPYPPGPFDEYLEIFQSNLPIILPASFLKFPNLTKLYLTRNSITNIQQGAFENLRFLQELHLDLNELTEVSEGVYNSLINLEILNLANNKITKVTDGAFVGLQLLKEINLENNLINVIQDHLFDSQMELRLLDLSGNPLEEFNGQGLQSMSALILAETSLTRLDNDFKHLEMEILNASSSHLESLDFSGFPKVEKIYFSNNKIISVAHLEKLDSSYIDLDNNQIKTLDGTFNDVSFLTLKNNKIEILTNTLFNESAALQTIDVSHNLISTIEKDAFRGLSVLQILHLEYNNISKIDPTLLSDLMELKYLDLSHNNIRDFQYGTFDTLIQLKILNISHNKLKRLNEKGFLFAVSLEQFIFNNNQISELDVTTLLKFKSQLKVVSINRNAWDCEYLAEMYVKLIANHSLEIDLLGLDEEGENFQGVACTSRKSYKWEDTEMSKFFKEDFEKSRFFQFFEKDYERSGFFKFLEEYKNGPRTQKLVAQPVEANSNDKLLLLSVIFQFLVVVLLLMNFWRKNRSI